MDIRGVRLSLHRAGEETVVSTQTVLPLPEAEAFRMGRRTKKMAETGIGKASRLDPAALMRIMSRLPEGRWTSYGAIAWALGRPGAGLGAGALLRNGDYPNAHRILRTDGKIAAGRDRGSPRPCRRMGTRRSFGTSSRSSPASFRGSVREQQR